MRDIYLTRGQGVAISDYVQEMLKAGMLPDLLSLHQFESTPKKQRPVTVKASDGNNQILFFREFDASGERIDL